MLNSEFNNLRTSLNFLHVSELKIICNKLQLSEKGKKGELIQRIANFIETGEKQVSPKFPKISCAKNGQTYELSKDSLMLKGAYKNDLKTRLFFKKLIGEHFHFTAFGIDWLNERWMNANPPTYQEFTSMWQEEHDFRRQNGSIPKDEWAYINFVKDYLVKNPKVSSSEILNQWKIERNKHKDIVDKFLADLCPNDYT